MASGSIAHKGNTLHALIAKSNFSAVWVVDSGASDHMTGDTNLLTRFQPCKQNWMVRIADGSLSKVAEIGLVAVSTNLTLNSVLLVPNLDCNLLSVSKLSTDHNCVVKFSQNQCEF